MAMNAVAQVRQVVCMRGMVGVRMLSMLVGSGSVVCMCDRLHSDCTCVVCEGRGVVLCVRMLMLYGVCATGMLVRAIIVVGGSGWVTHADPRTPGSL